jgi:segregation and condensation protein B
MTDKILSMTFKHEPDQAPLPLDSFAGEDGVAELAAVIESLALVSEEGVSVEAIASVTVTTVERVEAALAWHAEAKLRGVTLQRHGDTVTISSHPVAAAYIRRLLKLDREAKLSQAALETLAIVAYQQPATRGEIDAVRGVDSSGVLANLHNRGLVEALGRRASVGAPIEYGTTVEFLRLFSLNSLDDLPILGLVDGRDLDIALKAAVVSAGDVDSPIEAQESHSAQI